MELFLFIVIAFFVPTAHAAEPTVNVVEFYNAALKYYFITGDPVEASNIDPSVIGTGWVRTGGRFSAWKAVGDPPGLNPVCRFYGNPGKGANSNFGSG